MGSATKSSNDVFSLANNPKLRYFTFILLYFSQGIPEGITLFAIPAWMAMEGKSVIEIAAYNAIVIIPFSLKILLAPLIDRYTYLPMGRRKPWLLLGQAGIIITMIILSCISAPLHNIYLLTLTALSVHVFIMFQDIATDSLVIDIVPVEQQGKTNSLMWSSKIIGTSVTFFLGSWLINQYGFHHTVLVMATGVAAFMLVPLLIKERESEKLFPWSQGEVSNDSAVMKVDSWKQLFHSFLNVVVLKNNLLLIGVIFFTALAIHFLRTLLPVFTIQELGWDNIFFSKIFSISNLISGISGLIIGSWVIHHYGIFRLMKISFVLVCFVVFSMVFLEKYWQNSYFISGFIAVFSTLVTLINIGVFALAMKMCWVRISAFQFTFYMTIFNGGLMAGAALLGFLDLYFAWHILFIIFVFFMFVAFGILRYIDTRIHRNQIEILEFNYIKDNDLINESFSVSK